MKPIPADVERFLAQRRVAVAGVSRHPDQPANAIFRRLRDAGHEVFAVNPAAAEVEGVTCYPTLAAIPGGVGAVMVVTPPAAAAAVVAEAAELGIRHVWLHRSLGSGSVSPEAVRLGRELGLEVVVGGCPLMVVGRVDPFHRVMRLFRGPEPPVAGCGCPPAARPAAPTSAPNH